ncbi:MAG: tRNA threonylcarbamoyladenosine dehydratase [Clostridiales bacterium]|nr:tRNA threonylcarbamoyladenosine dehydratase [Clostridiales bacterium]
METQFTRTQMLFGENCIEVLKNKKVIVFGVGGVGSFVCEALARAGVGSITLVDNDTVNVTNINRQLCALHSTLGEMKTAVIAKRILDINPLCRVDTFNLFYLPGDSDFFHPEEYDFVVDAVDTVSAKIDIAVKCYEKNVNLISCMGTGNKTDPTRFHITDIYKTSVCPLCRVMRTEMKKRGVKKLTVLYSDETPVKPVVGDGRTPASAPFVPGCAGLIIAGHVIKTLLSFSPEA